MTRGRLALVQGQGRQHEPTELEGFRLRPCERPAWIEVGLNYEERDEWRQRAADSGLSTDVWVALQIEWTLVVDDLDPERAARVLARARTDAVLPALAPTEELRSWASHLVARSGPVTDDLPSVALPQRVLARLRPGELDSDLRTRVGRGVLEDAVTVEVAAAKAGMTLEAWAYRAACRLVDG
jgi:hypothetical protein